VTLPRPPTGFYDFTTHVIVFQVNALPATRTLCGGMLPNNGGHWPGCGITCNSAGLLSGFYISNNGLFETSTGVTVDLGRVYTAVITKPQTTAGKVSINGAAPVTITAAGGTIGQDNNSNTLYLTAGAGTLAFTAYTALDGLIYLNATYAGSSVWSDTEIQNTSRNPWDIFEPIQRQIWVPSGAAADELMAQICM
jgi:hypothetical protein